MPVLQMVQLWAYILLDFDNRYIVLWTGQCFLCILCFLCFPCSLLTLPETSQTAALEVSRVCLWRRHTRRAWRQLSEWTLGVKWTLYKSQQVVTRVRRRCCVNINVPSYSFTIRLWNRWKGTCPGTLTPLLKPSVMLYTWFNPPASPSDLLYIQYFTLFRTLNLYVSCLCALLPRGNDNKFHFMLIIVYMYGGNYNKFHLDLWPLFSMFILLMEIVRIVNCFSNDQKILLSTHLQDVYFMCFDHISLFCSIPA